MGKKKKEWKLTLNVRQNSDSPSELNTHTLKYNTNNNGKHAYRPQSGDFELKEIQSKHSGMCNLCRLHFIAVYTSFGMCGVCCFSCPIFAGCEVVN